MKIKKETAKKRHWLQGITDLPCVLGVVPTVHKGGAGNYNPKAINNYKERGTNRMNEKKEKERE